MLTVISPAKTLDYETPVKIRKSTMPAFLERSENLIERLRKSSPEKLQAMMGVSANIAELTHERVMNWTPNMLEGGGRQSILAFKGDVYTGLDAYSLEPKDFEFAQKRLRILSGLYGLLRPLDLMLPYRL